MPIFRNITYNYQASKTWGFVWVLWIGDKMAKAKTIFTCSCCGSLLTVPYVFNGNIYGSSCIKRINPEYSAKKLQGTWLKADSVTIEAIEGNQAVLVVAVINGIRFTTRSYDATGKNTVIMVESKLVCIADKSGNKFNNIVHNGLDGKFYKGSVCLGESVL